MSYILDDEYVLPDLIWGPLRVPLGIQISQVSLDSIVCSHDSNHFVTVNISDYRYISLTVKAVDFIPGIPVVLLQVILHKWSL